MVAFIRGAFFASFLLAGRHAFAGDTDWPCFGNDPGGQRFSTLRQISTKNVRDLSVAWMYHTGDARGNTPIQCTPIVKEGLMYLVTSAHRIAALDPATGVEKWSYDSKNDLSKSGHTRASRGLAYWSDGKKEGSRRILYGTPDGRILSVDAKTGLPDPKFRTVDLRAEVGAGNLYVGVSAAPTVYKDLVFVGIASGEGAGSAKGNIMAFSVLSGERRWSFDVVTTPNGGSAGAWNGYSLDQKRGILYAATGSESDDFEAKGRPENNLYSNCVLAINASTGKKLWHFQTVHGDVWDHDNASAPVLCQVRRNGKNVDAVAEVTKTGFCFVLDRVTGKPLFPLKGVADERGFIQPEPVLPPPLTDTLFSEDKITDLSPEAHAFVLKQLLGLSYGKKYLLPTANGTVVSPGYFGGSPWSGASFDPRTNTLFVNTNNAPSIMSNPPNYQMLVDHEGYPGVKPPWGNLTAIDLNSGKFAWRKTLGEYKELTARGIPPTGTLTFGGTLVTAGDLVFVGSTCDAKFRAFDSRTGDLVFSHDLPASAYAAPATYSVGGKQYVVIAASGGGNAKAFGFDHGPTSDTFVCFSLPVSKKRPETYSSNFMAGVQAWCFNMFTTFEAIEKTAKASSGYIELFPGQKLKPGSDVVVGPDMGESATAELKNELSRWGVKVVALGVPQISKDPNQARKLFTWAKGLGLVVVNTESTDALDTIEAMVREFNIKVGFHNHPKRQSDPGYRTWDPNYVMSLVKNRDRRIGACADIGHWVRSGVRPIDALRILKGRIVCSHMKDLSEFSASGHDVPFGTGVSDIPAIMKEFRKQGFQGPANVEFEYSEDNNTPEVASCLGFIRGLLQAPGN